MNRDRALDQVKASTFVGTNAAFLGCLLCGLKFQWSDEIETAGVSGDNLFLWNPQWFDSLTFEERQFILLHELWHIALLHAPRLGGRDAERWNIACDIRINNNLLKAGYSSIPAGGLRDIRYSGDEWTEEQIYDVLPPELYTQQPWGGNNAGVNTNKRVALVQSALNTAKLVGDSPGNVEKVFHDFVKPKLPWKSILHKYLLDLIEPEWSWQRPNKRYQDIYLPSFLPHDGRLIKIAVFLDTSGSITDEETQRFISEVKYIQEVLNPEQLMVIQFDTEIQDEKIYTSEHRFKDLVIRGYGGTEYSCVHDYILKNKPTVSLIFTDLCATPMESVGNNKVYWITTSREEANTGVTIHVED